MHLEGDVPKSVQLLIAHLVCLPDVLHFYEDFGLRAFRFYRAVTILFFHKPVHYVLLAASPSFFVCFLTRVPSFSVFRTRLGPVMTSSPSFRPLRIWRSDSPIMPVVTSTNFA